MCNRRRQVGTRTSSSGPIRFRDYQPPHANYKSASKVERMPLSARRPTDIRLYPSSAYRPLVQLPKLVIVDFMLSIGNSTLPCMLAFMLRLSARASIWGTFNVKLQVATRVPGTNDDTERNKETVAPLPTTHRASFPSWSEAEQLWCKPHPCPL